MQPDTVYLYGYPLTDIIRLINLWKQLVGPDQPLGVIPEGMSLRFTTGVRASLAFPNPVRPDDTTCPGVTRGPAACTCNRVNR